MKVFYLIFRVFCFREQFLPFGLGFFPFGFDLVRG